MAPGYLELNCDLQRRDTGMKVREIWWMSGEDRHVEWGTTWPMIDKSRYNQVITSDKIQEERGRRGGGLQEMGEEEGWQLSETRSILLERDSQSSIRCTRGKKYEEYQWHCEIFGKWFQWGWWKLQKLPINYTPFFFLQNHQLSASRQSFFVLYSPSARREVFVFNN